MAKITLELEDAEARALIHAASVHGRDMAGAQNRADNLEKIKRLDALRHRIEAAVTKAA